MRALEATVEITKAIVLSGPASNTSSSHLLTDAENRKKFLAGITELYKTLDSLGEEENDTTGQDLKV
jgi:hypothetical protein